MAVKQIKKKIDQKLPPPIESKDEFNKLKNCILNLKDNKFITGTNKFQYHSIDIKKLVRDRGNNRITKSDAINTLRENDTNIFEIKKIGCHGNKSTIMNTSTDSVKRFGPDYKCLLDYQFLYLN